jgi:hypothetical protein
MTTRHYMPPLIENLKSVEFGTRFAVIMGSEKSSPRICPVQASGVYSVHQGKCKVIVTGSIYTNVYFRASCKLSRTYSLRK